MDLLPLGYDVALNVELHYLTGDFNYFFVYYFTVVKKEIRIEKDKNKRGIGDVADEFIFRSF